MCDKCKKYIYPTKKFDSHPEIAIKQKHISRNIYAPTNLLNDVVKKHIREKARLALQNDKKGKEALLLVGKRNTGEILAVNPKTGAYVEEVIKAAKYQPFDFTGDKFTTASQKRRAERLRAKSFNTLAQFGKNSGIVTEMPVLNLANLRKRAAAKYLTSHYLQDLINLDSPLKKSYINTQYCASEIMQRDKKITSSYCKNRWCQVCNRIRTAHLMNSYLHEVEALQEKQFVTLTFANVSEYMLAPALDVYTVFWTQFYEDFRSKNKTAKKNGKAFSTLKGIRKIECTYNAKLDNYHPHMHLIIEGKKNAETIVNAWLQFCKQHNLKVDGKGQNIKACNTKTVKELFKYFTKIATDSGEKKRKKQKKGATVTTVTKNDKLIFVPAMDKIFQSMRGRRVYQSFGIEKKVNEDFNVVAETVEDLEAAMDTMIVWKWNNGFNWFHQVTETPITDYQPSNYEIELSKKIVT